MRIKDVEIKNFRNITEANISFGDINIFTGRNSSGKSNLLLALSTILKTKNDYTSEFGGNNVTIGKGRRNSTLRVRVNGVGSRTCFIGGYNSDIDTSFFCLEPDTMTFEKIIDKNSFSLSHKLIFTGKQYDNKNTKLSWSDFDKNDNFRELAEDIKDSVVYEKKFTKEEFIGNTNIVQADPVKGVNEDNYFSVFRRLEKTLISQIKSNLFSTDFSQINTALSIHKFVTEKGNEQIYQEAIKRLGGENKPSIKLSLEDSEFIFLISDIQRDPVIREKFYKDLNSYTKGIVSKIEINKKGTLSVISPNGPDGIWTISNGTSVLVFFITLINWLNLSFDKRSYQLPHIILLDEIDSIVHPTILSEFIEIIKAISRKVQVFLTTHSPYFLDGFSQEEIYYIKDSSSIAESITDGVNRCNIYSYKSIIENLDISDKSNLMEKKNSELFCEGIIDNIFIIK